MVETQKSLSSNGSFKSIHSLDEPQNLSFDEIYPDFSQGSLDENSSQPFRDATNEVNRRGDDNLSSYLSPKTPKLENLQPDEIAENKECAFPEKRPDLETVLKSISNGKIQVGTPILTDVVIHENKLRVNIQNVSLLQRFAKCMTEKGKHDLIMLKTEPKVVNIKQFDEQSLKFTKAEIVLKIFLNGTGGDVSKNNFVSVCVSAVNKTNQSKREFISSVRQNIPEEARLVVSVFLKHPKKEQKSFRKDFKMPFCAELEKDQKGIMNFISISEFHEYVHDDLATFGCAFYIDGQK